MVSSRHSDQSTNVDTPKHPAPLQQVTKHYALHSRKQFASQGVISFFSFSFIFTKTLVHLRKILQLLLPFFPVFELEISQALC